MTTCDLPMIADMATKLKITWKGRRFELQEDVMKNVITKLYSFQNKRCLPTMVTLLEEVGAVTSRLLQRGIGFQTVRQVTVFFVFDGQLLFE